MVMKMNNPLISVIVPVYNVEKYLSRCIDSILSQTFTDFELLLIDDGSKDHSGSICDEYAKTDSRIRVFHKENGGVSSARNIGLDNAKGEWVSFVDADDIIEQDYFPDDLLADEFWDVIQVPRSGGSNFHDYSKDVICANRAEAMSFLHKNFYYECWGRFIRKRVLGTTRFDETIKIGEDIIFFVSIFTQISTYYVTSKGGRYIYFLNETSAMSTNSDVHSKNLNNSLIIDRLFFIIDNNKKNTLAYVILISIFLDEIYKRNNILNVYKSIGLYGLIHLSGVTMFRKIKFLFLLVLSSVIK